tara:strand:- start:616 stop:801 length:186 start_codon:yes stop_codon:yes gene_type:complete
MKKEFNVGDLVRKVTKLVEFQNMFGVVVDKKTTESGFIYRVHYGEEYGKFWQSPAQMKHFV